MAKSGGAFLFLNISFLCVAVQYIHEYSQNNPISLDRFQGMDIKDWASWVLSYDGVIKLQGI